MRFYPILYKPFENDRGKQAIEYYKGIARATGGKCRVIPRGDEPAPAPPPRAPYPPRSP